MVSKRWIKSVFIHDQFQQLKNDLFADSVFDGAAALAYYLTLAVFPGLIFAFTLLPYLSLPSVDAIFSLELFNYLPTRAASTLESTILQVMHEPNAGLMSLSFLGGIVAASSGLAAVMRQMNIAYDIRETRSLLRVRIISVVLTLLLTAILLSAVGVIVVGGMLMSDGFLRAIRWIVIMVTVYSGVSVIYYVAPDMNRLGRPYRYFSPGSWLATVLILISTFLLSLYLANFDSYNKIYGSIAGVIVLMVWFYLIGMALLMGAELNHFFREKSWLKHIQ